MESVINVIKTYGIKLSQVYSLTTDNGGNYLRAVRLIAKGGSADDDGDETDEEDDCFDINGEIERATTSLSATYAAHSLALSTSEWETIENVNGALQPAKYATMDLQLEKLTCGDFHPAWLKCKSETSAIKTPLAESVLQCMKPRLVFLYQSNAFVAGVFLDPM